MDLVKTVGSDNSLSIDLMLIVKILCLVLITIKLTRMFYRRSNNLEQIVSKLSMPYYQCFDELSPTELNQHVEVIRNTILNRCVQLPQMLQRMHTRFHRKVTIDEKRNRTCYFHEDQATSTIKRCTD